MLAACNTRLQTKLQAKQTDCQGSQSDGTCVCLAGMTTSRGRLMSTILFPAPMVFKYDEELPIVIALMVLYAIPCAVCTIAFQYSNGSYSEWPTKFVYCMGIVNQCLNPLLPVVLTIGDVQAVRRLKVCTSHLLLCCPSVCEHTMHSRTL